MPSPRWKIVENVDGTCTIRRVTSKQYSGSLLTTSAMLEYPDISMAEFVMKVLNDCDVTEIANPRKQVLREHLFDQKCERLDG